VTGAGGENKLTDPTNSRVNLEPTEHLLCSDIMCGETPQNHSVDLEPTGPNMPNTNARADADGQIQQLREMLIVRHTHKVPQRTGKADELQTSKTHGLSMVPTKKSHR
jgi:hypothetical protein